MAEPLETKERPHTETDRTRATPASRPRPSGAGKTPRRRVGRRRRRLRRAAWTLAALGAAGLAVSVWIYRSSRPETWRPGEDLPEITERLSRGVFPPTPPARPGPT